MFLSSSGKEGASLTSGSALSPNTSVIFRSLASMSSEVLCRNRSSSNNNSSNIFNDDFNDNADGGKSAKAIVCTEERPVKFVCGFSMIPSAIAARRCFPQPQI